MSDLNGYIMNIDQACLILSIKMIKIDVKMKYKFDRRKNSYHYKKMVILCKKKQHVVLRSNG